MTQNQTILLGVAVALLIAVTAGAGVYMATNDDVSKTEPAAGGIKWDQAESRSPAPAPQQNCDDGNVVGKVIGGVGGGAAASNVGKGSGKTAATIAGTLGGHLVGIYTEVSQALRFLGWEVYTTYYVPNVTLAAILVAAGLLAAIGILGRRGKGAQDGEPYRRCGIPFLALNRSRLRGKRRRLAGVQATSELRTRVT